MKEQILKKAEIEWGLRVGPKSNQREQTRVLLSILSKAIAQTREETIRDEIKRKEEMIITKDNAEELVHTPLCKENPEKGNNHFFCNITNADYFRNQVILEDIKYLKELLNKLKK